MSKWALLLPILLLITTQGALTGVFGAPSVVATIVATRAMSSRRAILLSTLAQLIGPFLFGVAVATSLDSDVVNPAVITPHILYGALAATVVWMLLAWYFRIPSSSTHALIGGLVGAVLAGLGPAAIHSDGLIKILIGLILTAPLGILGGFVVARLCHTLIHHNPHANQRFNQGQFILAMFLGLVVGSNNAQKAMGVTVLGLMATGFLPRFEIPTWVIIVSALCLAAGNLVGGTRLLHSVGTQFCEVQPLHGFSAEMSSMLIILASSLVGGNVSTTQITSMSILGAGASQSTKAVQWRFVRNVFLTWVLTIPITAALACLICLALTHLGVP